MDKKIAYFILCYEFYVFKPILLILASLDRNELQTTTINMTILVKLNIMDANGKMSFLCAVLLI